MKKKTAVTPAPVSPVQDQSFQISKEQQAAQTGEVNQANQTIDTAKQGVSPYLAGSDGMSEFRRALTGNLTHATANTGDSVLAHSRERAAAAGFGGGNQPIQVGAENELANEQAGRIAAIPGQVEQQAAPLEMQAANEMGNLGNEQLSAARVFNPESYYSAGTNLAGQNYQDYLNQLQQQRQKKSGIWGALAKVGLSAASAIPGVGPVASAAMGTAGGMF